MPPMTTPSAIEACESAISEDRRYNVEHDIWPSSVEVAARFLDRRTELAEAYVEIHTKLGKTLRGLPCFFDLLFGAVTVWGPEEMKQARADRQTLVELNKQIKEQAMSLATLMERRTDLSNKSGFSSNTHYHVLEVVEKAGSDRHAFTNWAKNPLAAVRSQFDLKYWPTPADFVRELARDAAEAEPSASDPVTEAATTGRAAKADFFKALFEIIEENSSRFGGPLPLGFELSDKTLASLGNCALDLPPDELITDEYVKNIRQRLRAARAKKRS
jgi:hypothetical protein